MIITRLAPVLLVAGLAAACGGGDDDAVASHTTAEPTTTTTAAVPPAADPTTIEACIDLYVEASNQLDLTGIDAADGIDREEALLADERLVAMEEANPVLADDSECALMLEDATPEQVQAFMDRLDPTVLLILQTPIERFQEVGPAIDG